MAALDLSRESNFIQVRDLIRVVDENRGLLRVHPLTLKEIDSILYSVEQDGGPSQSSELAEAWDRRNLNITDTLFIRQQLGKHIEKVGISVVSLGKQELEKAQDSCDRGLVKRLAERRKSNEQSCFREVHDICLWEYVSKKAGNSRDSKQLDAYLITSNVDLITLTKENLSSSRRDCLVRPDNVILRLWMQGGLRSEMKKELLSAKLTKCFVANDVDTTYRMGKVLKCFGKDPPPTEEQTTILFGAIAKRDPAYLQLTDQLSGNDTEADVAVISQIKAKVSEDEKKRGEERQLWKQKEELLIELGSIREKKVKISSQVKSLEEKREKGIHPWKRWTAPVVRWSLVVLGVGLSYYSFSSQGEEECDVSRWLLSFGIVGGCPLFELARQFVKSVGWKTLFKLIGNRGEMKQVVKEYLNGFLPISKALYVEQQRAKWEEKTPQYAELQKNLSDLEGNYNEVCNQLADLGVSIPES